MLLCELELEKRKEQGNLRELTLLPPLIDFSSNDYLGLARSEQFAKAFLEEIQDQKELRMGATGSRLLTGNSLYAEALEATIAAFHGHESGLLFNCGYMANVGLISAIAREGSVLLFDSAIHASTHDGIRLSRATAFPFKHNDLTHLESRLKAHASKSECFICIESIYSTDGSKAPLKEIAFLAERYSAHLIVDEAHAVGVWGKEGRGLVEKEAITDALFAHVVTFGKALGAQGAIVLGSQRLKRLLVNFATSYIYSTALSFQMLAAIKCSYDLFPQKEQERKALFQLMQIAGSKTQIHPFLVKGNDAVKEKSRQLIKEGFDVRALMSPTVRRGEEALRICLHAFNREEELGALLRFLHA